MPPAELQGLARVAAAIRGSQILSACRSFLARFQEPSLSLMLGLQIVIMFVAFPLRDAAIPDAWLMNAAPFLLGTVSLLLVSQSRPSGYIAFVGMGLSLAGLALKSLLPSGISAVVVATASSLLFSGTIFWVVGQKTFGDGPVTGHKLRGALLIYLNIAFTFAVLHHLLYRQVAQAYSGVDPTHSLGDLLYFSLSTLTCSGYGDILPRHPLARSLATLEAVTGQLYLSTFIATLIGLHVSFRQRSVRLRHNSSHGRKDS